MYEMSASTKLGENKIPTSLRHTTIVGLNTMVLDKRQSQCPIYHSMSLVDEKCTVVSSIQTPTVVAS